MKQFKRIISLVIAMTMLVSMFSVGIVSASAEDATYLLGDVNKDGKVNIFDATYIQKHVAGFENFKIAENTVEFAAADVNRDGKVNIFDVTIIQQYVAQFDEALNLGIGESFTFEDPDKPDPTLPTQEETQAPVTEPTEEPTQEPETESTEVETVAPTEEETVAPTEEETVAPTEEETEQPSDDEVTAGYYLVGTLNGESLWNNAPLTNDRKFEENTANPGEYMLDWTFYANDEIKVVYYNGTEIETWYKDLADNYVIGADSDKIGDCTVYFNPNGNADWSYTYFTVQPKSTPVDPTEEETVAPTEEETVAPTEEETVAPTDEETVAPTEEETDAPVKAEAGYYLVGTLNGENCWFVDDTAVDRQLKENTANPGEYMLDWTFYANDEIKVVYYNGTAIETWYKDLADNYKIGAESDKVGDCTVYFNPNGNADWSYTYFTVQPKSTPVDPTEEETVAPTEEETVAPTEEETVAPTEEETDAPVKAEAGYYLVGTLNGENCWFVDDTAVDRQLKENTANPGEYMLDWTFYANDEIKVVYYNGTAIETWYKDLADNYKIGAESDKVGDCTIYFMPEGNADWSYTYFTVQPKSTPVDPTEEETVAPTEEETVAPTEEETVVPTEEETEAPADDTITIYFENNWMWPDAKIYFWGSETAENPAWNGIALTEEVGTTEDGYTVYKYELPADVDGLLFNGTGEYGAEQSSDIKDGWYDGICYYMTYEAATNTKPCGSYKYEVVEDETVAPTEEETVAPTEEETVAPTEEDTVAPTEEETDAPVKAEAGYYLVGTLNGENCWFVDDTAVDRQLKENTANPGEYMLDWTFYANDEIKVVYYNGTAIETWYKDLADNYKIGAESEKVGDCTIYFMPEGNADWSYTYFTVQPKSTPVDPTEEETVAPTEEETVAPTEEETLAPTEEETVAPTEEETVAPTEEETVAPTEEETVAPTEEETVAPTEEETVAPTEEETVAPTEEETDAPVKAEAGYYLVGTLNGENCWFVDDTAVDRQLKENTANLGEYMLDWTFYANDEIKVVYYNGTAIETWYKDLADNYKIGAESEKVGDCTIYFMPEGNADWSYTYFTVQPKSTPVDPTEEETVAPTEEETVAPTEEETEEETVAPTEATGYTVYFVNSGKWSKVNAYVWEPNDASWPGSAMTKTGETAPNGADVYSITFSQSHGNIIFNDGSSQTADLTFQAGKYYDFATSKWYDSLDDISSDTPTGYTVYCVNSKSWSTVNAYVWNPNGSSWPGSAMTKTGDKSPSGYDVYSFTSTQNHGNVIFNNGSGTQTADLTFQAGKYYDLSSGKWYDSLADVK